MLEVLDKENTEKDAVFEYEQGKVDDDWILPEEDLIDGVYRYIPGHISMKKYISVVKTICVMFTARCQKGIFKDKNDTYVKHHMSWMTLLSMYLGPFSCLI